MRCARRVTAVALVALLFLVVPVGSRSTHAAPRIEVLPKSAKASQQTLAAGPTNPQEMDAFLDDFFEVKMAELHIPGAAIVVVKDGQMLFAKGFGFADLARQIPVGPASTAFRVGSVSKLFTWTAVMQATEQMGHEMGHQSARMGHEGTPTDTILVSVGVMVKQGPVEGPPDVF